MNTLPALPEPSTDARAASSALHQRIAGDIATADGWIPFSRYMELALYAPELGYYSGGSRKFGEAGDFITAPEISPLFSRTLATPAAWVMEHSAHRILEAGAGSGLLAAELLVELERSDSLPDEYLILDISGELRARQAETLRARMPQLLERVRWLDELPQKFSGLVLGNELLDAMPAALVEWRDDPLSGATTIAERGVSLDERGGFVWTSRPAQGALLAAAQALNLTAPHVSEIGLAASAWVAEWGRRMESGAVLLLDYGFPRREFYHPQRNRGTLMCHYRHHAHEDPFWWPGLNDITAHVDFTAIAEAGFDAGLDILGYTSQARFLLNCGITDRLERLSGSGNGDKAYIAAARSVDKLLSPGGMGELFKVIAFGRGLPRCLPGFAPGDRLHTL